MPPIMINWQRDAHVDCVHITFLNNIIIVFDSGLFGKFEYTIPKMCVHFSSLHNYCRSWKVTILAADVFRTLIVYRLS